MVKLLVKLKNILVPILIVALTGFLLYVYETQGKELKEDSVPEKEVKAVVAEDDNKEINQQSSLLNFFIQGEDKYTIGDKEYVYFYHNDNACEFLLPDEENLDFSKFIGLNVDPCVDFVKKIKETAEKVREEAK